MPLVKEVLELIAGNIVKAKGSLAALKEVVADMRLAGMDTTNQNKEVDRLTTDLRALEIFYERQKAKS